MKLNLNLLNKFIDISSLSVDNIINRLTFSGFEVEGVEKVVDSDVLVIGQIIESKIDAENKKVNICKIDIGSKKLNIITTANNVRVGLKTVVAVDGTFMKTINKTIKTAKLYGHESQGMMIGWAELGVDSSYLSQPEKDGLIELNDDAPIGSDFFKYFNIDLPILDVSILPNRIDTYNYLNMAKEFESLFGLKIRKEIEFNQLIKSDFKNDYSIKILSDNCSLYSLSNIKNIKVTQSPMWIRLLLWLNNVSALNNIVDAGNLTTIILNQPVHAFDAKLLASKIFEIKELSKQSINTLNNKTYELDKDLVIFNQKPLVVAGIIGGVDSSINENTNEIVFEVAAFDSVKIRDTSKRLNCFTDSSIRYSRGVYGFDYLTAHNIFCNILKYTNKNISISDVIVENKNKDNKNKIIEIDFDYIVNYSSILDLKIEEVKNCFNLLGFDFNIDNNIFKIEIPNHRRDVENKKDIIEEIVRLIGYERVVPILPKINVNIDKPINLKYNFSRKLKSFLFNNGLYETITYSLTSDKKAREFNILYSPDKYYKLANEISNTHSTMRTSVVPGLLEVINLNNNKQIKDVNIFEISKLYFDDCEKTVLAIASSGDFKYSHLHPNKNNDFYAIKGLVVGLLNIARIKEDDLKFLAIEENDFMHFGKTAKIYFNSILIGYVGQIHPLVQTNYKIKKPVFVAEIDIEKVYDIYSSTRVIAEEISIYPKVSRDISLLVDDKITSQLIVDFIKQLKIGNLINIEIFDFYKNEELKNEYALGIRIDFQSIDSTLNDVYVNEQLTKVINEVIKKFKLKIRE